MRTSLSLLSTDWEWLPNPSELSAINHARGRTCHFFRVYSNQSLSVKCQHWGRVGSVRIALKLWAASRRGSRMILGSSSMCAGRWWRGDVSYKQCPWLWMHPISSRLRRARVHSIAIPCIYPLKIQRPKLMRNWRSAPQDTGFSLGVLTFMLEHSTLKTRYHYSPVLSSATSTLQKRLTL